MSGKIRLIRRMADRQALCLFFGVALELNYAASLDKKCFLLISYRLTFSLPSSDFY
jgi:hypothetical protein